MAALGWDMSVRETLDPEALAALEEQRSFLRRSLGDLEREHVAGDLDEHDYESLRDDYEHRLEAVRSAIEDGKAVLAAARPRNPRRSVVIVGLVVVFALGCGFVVAQLAGRRGSGDEVSGAILQTSRDKLALCLSSAFSGDIAATVACYDDVLKTDPTNEEALTYRAGIKVVSAGDPSGIADLIEVAKNDPSYPDVHAFLAVAFDLLGRPESALAELHKLASLNPAPLLLDLTASLRTKLEASTTTTSTTAPG
ncbi:MAG: hypothetical protein QOE63_889 [Acidimicrobiaceae bacterium]|jgi:tetratricopeptide (TPR) repeat protein